MDDDGDHVYTSKQFGFGVENHGAYGALGWRAVRWREVLRQQIWSSFIYCLLVLVVTFVISTNIGPRHFGFMPNDPSVAYPIKEDTVPTWVLFLTVPMASAIMILVEFTFMKAHHKTLTHFLWICIFLTIDFHSCVFISLSFCQATKYAVGRLRPDFLARCMLQSDLIGSAEMQTADDACMNPNKDVIREGHVSFFSGHSAMAFTVASYLSLYLTWTFYFRVRRTKTLRGDMARELWEVVRLTAVWTPLILAGFVGFSRICDHKHHVSDVVGGSLIGGIVGAVFFVRALSLSAGGYPRGDGFAVSTNAV